METNEPKPWVQDIQRRCQVMAERARERAATEIVHLPAWPEHKRGTPNSFIRSALFAAIQSKDRVFIKDQVLASQQGIIVKFTGEQLNQEDLTVWEALVHLAKQHPLGHTCRFSGHSILSLIDLPKSADHYKTLQNSIERLAACLVKIENHRHVYGGSLVHRFMIDKTTKHFEIELNRDLIALFQEDDWTAIEWQQRLAIRRKPLAQALHAYYSSHRTPHPVKLSTLKDLTGSRNNQAASFKRQCRAALDVLVTIGFLQSYEIDGELVSVKRIQLPVPKNH